LSSRPERTRISCCAAVDKAACAAFRKESRMKLAEPTKFNRKSGGAQWRDLQFLSPPHPSLGTGKLLHHGIVIALLSIGSRSLALVADIGRVRS
jgi:hypothetical protein